jgi:TolA-binding protein
MSGLTLLFILFSRFYDLTKILEPFSRWFDRYGIKVTLIAMGIGALSATYYLIYLSPEFPVLSYNRGIKCFAKEDYATAKKYFREVVQWFPQTLLVDQAAFHYAMCFFREKDWAKTIRALEWLLETYPETRKAAEASYHIGLCYLKLGKTQEAQKTFKETIEKFPKEIWAGYARDRLKEIQSP